MKREIKFRVFWRDTLKLIPDFTSEYVIDACNDDTFITMQFTGLHDKNGKEIYEGDILEFSDKWEWYRGSYAIKMRFANEDQLKKLKEAYENEPMERRVIEMPSCYEWILSSEIQTYWQVIGNIYENPELIN